MKYLFVVIFATPSNFLGAIELLGQNKPDKLMRKNKLRKRPNEVGAAAHIIRHPICPANDKHDILACVLNNNSRELG